MPEPDDRYQLNRLKKGDPVIFEHIFRKYYKPLYRYAYRFVLDQATAEDAVQEVFIALWEKREALMITVSLEAYLFRAVRNRSINQLKDLYNSRKSGDEIPADAHPLAETSDEKLTTPELEKLLTAGIRQLPERCRIIFNLSRNGGLTYDEIAEDLGVSRETVKSQIKIALKKLREYLGENWEKLPVILLFRNFF